jgi:hypothetical protein
MSGRSRFWREFRDRPRWVTAGVAAGRTALSALPEIIPLIAGDAAHNIRSALDHFAWAAVSPEEHSVQTCFPVWNSTAIRTPDKWKKQADRQLKGASSDLIDAVTKLEPWEAGRDSLLWAIHELDRVDNHRLLLSVAVALTGVGLNGDSYDLAVTKKFSGGDPTKPLALEPIKWTPLEEGIILFGFPVRLRRDRGNPDLRHDARRTRDAQRKVGHNAAEDTGRAGREGHSGPCPARLSGCGHSH